LLDDEEALNTKANLKFNDTSAQTILNMVAMQRGLEIEAFSPTYA